jgi:Asp/Glu/hydantoin racemase
MRLLLVNPNTTGSMTEQMAEIARSVAPPGTDIVPLTAKSGFPYISSRAEAQVAGALALEMIAGAADRTDAAIIAAFGDPGLSAARDLFGFPVVGMAQAALQMAAVLGERISIVTFSPVMRRWYTDSVCDAGLLSRFTGVRTPPTHLTDLGDVQDRLRPELLRLCALAAEEDGADVVVLGGAPLAGLASKLGNEAGVRLVDPISAATLQAVALASLARSQGRLAVRKGALAKPTMGLSPPLARHFEGKATP